MPQRQDLEADVAPAASFRHRRGLCSLEAPLICGILNITPDSFSDGGDFIRVDIAVRRALEMESHGAGIVDIGGESTRPGCAEISVSAEVERVVPVIAKLRQESDVLISVDTTKASVAEEALSAGADIINDISGGLFDPRLPRVSADAGAAYICGHVQGRTIEEVHEMALGLRGVAGVLEDLALRVSSLPLGLAGRVVVDPCLGFGKRGHQNIELIANSAKLASVSGCPVLIGPSRKRFLGELTALPVHERDSATVGACLAAIQMGAKILRVHNVKALSSALKTFRAVHDAL